MVSAESWLRWIPLLPLLGAVLHVAVGHRVGRGPLGVLAGKPRLNALLGHDPLGRGMPGVGLRQLRDAETGRTRLVDAGALASRRSIEERIREIRQLGARATAISTAQDPFRALEQHLKRAVRR